MVYKSRNLLYDESLGVFEPIYKTQGTTYIQRTLRNLTGDYKEDRLIRFFSTNPASQKSQWLNKQDKLNAIVAVGDDINYTIDEENGICDLAITFNGNIKNLQIETSRTTSATRV